MLIKVAGKLDAIPRDVMFWMKWFFLLPVGFLILSLSALVSCYSYVICIADRVSLLTPYVKIITDSHQEILDTQNDVANLITSNSKLISIINEKRKNHRSSQKSFASAGDCDSFAVTKADYIYKLEKNNEVLNLLKGRLKDIDSRLLNLKNEINNK